VFVRLRKPPSRVLASLVERAANSDLTYREVGATAGDVLPSGTVTTSTRFPSVGVLRCLVGRCRACARGRPAGECAGGKASHQRGEYRRATFIKLVAEVRVSKPGRSVTRPVAPVPTNASATSRPRGHSRCRSSHDPPAKGSRSSRDSPTALPAPTSPKRHRRSGRNATGAAARQRPGRDPPTGRRPTFLQEKATGPERTRAHEQTRDVLRHLAYVRPDGGSRPGDF
jgi:hypothetical protein